MESDIFQARKPLSNKLQEKIKIRKSACVGSMLIYTATEMSSSCLDLLLPGVCIYLVNILLRKLQDGE